MKFVPNPDMIIEQGADQNFFRTIREERESLNMLRGKSMPLQWEGFVNEVTHAINQLRRDVWACKPTDKIGLKINLCDEQGYSAILCESEYIKKSCQLSSLTLRKTVGRGATAIAPSNDEQTVEFDMYSNGSSNIPVSRPIKVTFRKTSHLTETS